MTKYTYEPKSDEELKRVALGILSGTIFTSQGLGEHELPLVFMVLGFMDQDSLDRMKEAEITLLYEDISKAGPRSINSMPMFSSCHQLSRSDHLRLNEMIKKLQEAINAV